MKRTSIIFALALAALVSCQKENTASPQKGVELTISAEVAAPVGTKTTYSYTASLTDQAGTISTSWEATEKITVVSISNTGITAVDEFSSTGAAGRSKAEFTGTWNGNTGDKVICLYPALSTTAGAERYSGVTVGSTSIGVDFPAHALSQDISTIKDYDLMIGDVAINGTTASVTLQRKISVIRLGISGASPYEYGVYGRYIQKLGIAARSSGGDAKLFASSGTIAATTASWTGEIVPSAFYVNNWNGITQITKEGTFYHYIPVLVDGSLDAGDILSVCFTDKEYYGSTWDSPNNKTKEKTIESTLVFSPGYVYAINAAL